MRSIRVSIPGKVMLAGEYAVLHGLPCIAFAVDRRLTVEAETALSTSVQSNLWPRGIELDSCRKDFIKSEPLLQTADAALKLYGESANCELAVRSELDVAFGLGSSSAVRLGALLAMEGLAKGEILSPWNAAKIAWELQRTQQSFASGYDLVTQAHGGLLRWQPRADSWPGDITRLDSGGLQGWVHVFVGGRGAPTATVGGSVRRWLEAEGLTPSLLKVSDELVETFVAFFADTNASNLSRLIGANAAHRQLFVDAPGYPVHLLQALHSLPGFDQEWSFKTTGAGGEDAVLLLGEASKLSPAIEALHDLGWQQLMVRCSEAGASWQLEEISP